MKISQKIRKLLRNDEADVNMILAAVVMAIGLAIGIIITYSVIGSVDADTIDAGLTGSPAENAASALINSTGTFYTVAPIALIVVAAVAILGYVMLLRRR